MSGKLDLGTISITPAILSVRDPESYTIVILKGTQTKNGIRKVSLQLYIKFLASPAMSSIATNHILCIYLFKIFIQCRSLLSQYLIDQFFL